MRKNWSQQEDKILINNKNQAKEELLKPHKDVCSLIRGDKKMNGIVKRKKEAGVLRSVLIPDAHHPSHNKEVWGAIFKFIKWFKPHTVVLTGDACDMQAINHWKKQEQNQKYFEGKRLIAEYRAFERDILNPLMRLSPKAEHVYMGGNHEEWAYQLIEKQPSLEGTIEPEVAMDLKAKGWKWIKYIQEDKFGNVKRGIYQIGKLAVTHGEYLTNYHAARMSNVYSKSVAYCHTHDVQLYTKTHIEDTNDYHTAQSLGCTCDKSPSYGKGRPNRWVHAFGVLYTRQDGSYNLYVPIIIKGEFTFAGKTFRG